MSGYDVWVAINDQNKECDGEKFIDLCLKNLPKFTNPEVLNIAQYVDVIWFKKNSTLAVRFFEIETTATIYSGLLRLNDIVLDFPIEKAFIISSNDRAKLFYSQINRNTFVSSGLESVCEYLTYDDVCEYYKKISDYYSIRDKI